MLSVASLEVASSSHDPLRHFISENLETSDVARKFMVFPSLICHLPSSAARVERAIL